MGTGGSIAISDKESIEAVHKTLTEAVEATNRNSMAVNRLSRWAIVLAFVQAFSSVVQILPQLKGWFS